MGKKIADHLCVSTAVRRSTRLFSSHGLKAAAGTADLRKEPKKKSRFGSATEDHPEPPSLGLSAPDHEHFAASFRTLNPDARGIHSRCFFFTY